MKLLLFSVFLLVSCNYSLAQTTLKSDTAGITIRMFDKQTLNELKNDSEFQYDKWQEPPVSWWDRFWSWFWWKVGQLLSTNGGKTTIWGLLILFGVSMIAFFVLKVTGMNRDSLFGRSSNRLPFTTTTEDINSISFDEAINEAIANGNYRLATRLLYLQALKLLSDKGYIEWQKNKTNTDYLNEVSTNQWHPVFSSLTRNFEYTWYGAAPVNQERFLSLRKQFLQFNNQLR
jgi:hypothetical protein